MVKKNNHTVYARATFSEYDFGQHYTNGGKIAQPLRASIAESMSLFHSMLTDLAKAGVERGTRLTVVISTK